MKTTFPGMARGFSLIEAMIAVVVLSFGLLSLAVLQSSLFRAGAEAKARSNAMSIAQGALEAARSFAFTQPPTATYTSDTGFTTYTALATAPLASTVSGGITYSGCRQVVRYVFDQATGQFVATNTVNYSASASGGTITVQCTDTVTTTTAFDPARPEFKQVSVAVAWPGDTGEVKTIQITDTVSSVSPSDSVMVLKSPDAGILGPSIYITPPGGTGVVPIAIGTNESGEEIAAASSNPKPEQFVDDMSAVTNFTVQTFTGDRNSDSVLLNRQQQVSVASCICRQTLPNAQTSSVGNLAYGPTIWNGKQLAYLEPQAIIEKPIAAAVISSSDSEITSVCTTCCRDHHDASLTKQPISFDPYRPAADRASGGDHNHYGFKKISGKYDLAKLYPVSETGGEYVEACRLIRVNGRFRVAVDSSMNYLAVTPMNNVYPPTGFQNSGFVDDYSSLVSRYVGDVMAGIPMGYPSATSKLPLPSQGLKDSFASTVDNPPTIAIKEPEKRQLVAFGLYIDYLSKDTIEAYKCASPTPNNTGDCEGYGNRNPLEFIPFYAVNVANLGAWASDVKTAASVTSVLYDNQGRVSQDGGIVEARSGTSPSDVFLVKEHVKLSNTGLTNTVAVDPDDMASDSDGQRFSKTGGNTENQLRSIYISLVNSININNLKLTFTATDPCARDGNSWTCDYNRSLTAITLRIAGFSTKNADNQICLPTGLRSTATPGGTSENEYLDVPLKNLNQSNWYLTLQLVAQTNTCGDALHYDVFPAP